MRSSSQPDTSNVQSIFRQAERVYMKEAKCTPVQQMLGKIWLSSNLEYTS